MKVYLAGEGEHELGKWAQSVEYGDASTRTDGVLFALFCRAGRDGRVVAGKRWRGIRKYRSGGHASAEQRVLRQLAVEAEEQGADVLLWTRDTDHDAERASQLKSTHEEIKATFAGALEIIGEPANPCIEAWIIAIAGHHRTPETLSVPKLAELAATHGVDTDQAMVDLINSAELDTSGSESLEAFVAQLRPAGE